MTINIVCREHIAGGRLVSTWMIEWPGPEMNSMRFLTRSEAEATRDAIEDYCAKRRTDPRTLPFAAIIILIEAIKRGRDGIRFVVAESESGEFR